MSSKRSSPAVGRRLRVELLEFRDVPSAGVGDPNLLPPDPTIPVQIGTDVPPADPAPEVLNPIDVISIATAIDGTPQGPAVDLAAFASVDRIRPSLGDVVTIKVTIANNGPVQATGVVANAPLPAGMTFVSADVGPSKFDPATGAWTIGTIASKGTAVLTFKAKVTDVAPQSIGASIAHADQLDDKLDNNAASVNVTPVLGALNLSKTASTPAVQVGSTVVFTIAVGNAGPGTARGVAVTDTLGAGLKFVKVLTASQGSYNAGTGVWSVGAVPAGSIAVLRVLATVNKFARIESPATVSGTGFDAARSKVDATAVVTGVKPAGPATWSYYSGPNFGSGATPVPAPARGNAPALPPILLVNGAKTTTAPSLMQFLLNTGFKFPGMKL